MQSTFQSRQPFPAPLSVGPCALSHRHAQPRATALLPSTPWVVSLVFPRWHLKRMCCAYLSHYVCVCLGVCRCMCVRAEATDVACLFFSFFFPYFEAGFLLTWSLPDRRDQLASNAPGIFPSSVLRFEI